MSAGLNQITILGRLGNDPITRDTRTETTVTHFDVAVDESYKSKAGDKVEKVTSPWLDIPHGCRLPVR